MNSHHDDSILDACLDEVLGNRTPPDLTDRVLKAWAMLNTDSKSAIPGAPPANLPVRLPKAKQLIELGLPAPPFVAALPLLQAQAPVQAGLRLAAFDTSSSAVIELSSDDIAASRQSKGSSSLWAITVAASVVGLGLTVGLAALLLSNRDELAQQRIAELNQQNNAAQQAAALAQLAADLRPSAESARTSDSASTVVELEPKPGPEPVQLVGNSTPTVPDESEGRAVPSAPAEPAYPKPAADAEVVSYVNAELARGWTGAHVQPASQVSDEEWCQRVFKGVLGRAATTAEGKQFIEETASLRRVQLVDRLLTQTEYAEEFARHWSAVWAGELLGAKGGQSGSLASRQQLEQYLFAALCESKPFNKITEELLTATGSSQPDAEDYNPAVNFLLDGWDATGTVATMRVARVFLGRQLQCAQCHEHPTEGSSQEQFWSFNSFFRQMRAQRQDGAARLVNVDFLGERRGSRDGEVFFETPTGLMKAAFPRFFDGTEIPTSGLVATVDRRRELARLVTQSDDLPRSVVNRVWAHFFDYGFLPPVHDLKSSGDSAHAALLERMASEFVAHGYDLKSVIRWAVLSDPFTRSAKLTDLASKDMPEAGETALFSRFYSRPAAAAEVFNSLVQAQRIRKTTGNDSERDQARIDWLAQFNRAATKGGSKAGGKVKASILAQDLHSIRVTAGTQPGALVPKLAFSQMSFDKKVEHLFLAALARRPIPREARAAGELLVASKDNQPAALEDIWWALLNSSECVLDR